MTIFNRASASVSNANMLEGIQEAVKAAAWPVKYRKLCEVFGFGISVPGACRRVFLWCTPFLCSNFFPQKDKNMPLYHSVRICLTNYYIGVAVFSLSLHRNYIEL